ncbi:hypothetical protein L210DRAFT_3120395 [Boletus edulis BED1]|uniref:Uncharacterized protein n=1 Tax=Boletus edulis BED1 TaxID=1328754 RepID=A0AAD4BG19_BOLED|nr:hypothetical protein L210DRAFT_3120395 [Boletus edulis BED1]
MRLNRGCANCAGIIQPIHELRRTGRFDVKLEELYRSGKQDNWKPPPTMPMATPRHDGFCMQGITQPCLILLPSTLSS